MEVVLTCSPKHTPMILIRGKLSATPIKKPASLRIQVASYSGPEAMSSPSAAAPSKEIISNAHLVRVVFETTRDDDSVDAVELRVGRVLASSNDVERDCLQLQLVATTGPSEERLKQSMHDRFVAPYDEEA